MTKTVNQALATPASNSARRFPINGDSGMAKIAKEALAAAVCLAAGTFLSARWVLIGGD